MYGVAALLACVTALQGEGLPLLIESSEKYGAVYESSRGVSPLIQFDESILAAKPPPFISDTTVIDFESRQITFRTYDSLSGLVLHQFHYGELSRYLSDMYENSLEEAWAAELREKGIQERRRRAREGDDLTFALPTDLPVWARRILGDEPPQLSISGTQSLRLGYERRVSGVEGNEDNFKTSSAPVFEPQSNFRIQGSVGRLLELEIILEGKTGSDAFSDIDDQLSEIKLHYRESYPGELEDDIIQEVEVGRTNFNLPGLNLMGYPSGGEGLFGIKVNSRFGPLDLTTIMSTEQTESKSERIDLNADARPVVIHEKDYVKNRFFFVDTLYREIYNYRFKEGNRLGEYLNEVSADLGISLTDIPRVERLELYKQIPLNTDETGERDFLMEYENPDGSPSIGRFRRMSSSDDYSINRNFNWIHFEKRLGDRDVILMSAFFSDEYPAVGTPEIVDTIIEGESVELYKNMAALKHPDSELDKDYAQYSLMLRNVYSINKGSAEDFEFDIKRVNDDGSTNRSNQDDSLYIDILGLTTGDGLIDANNSNIFDHNDGYVFIPPYEPEVDTVDKKIHPTYPFSNPSLGTNLNNEPNTNIEIYDSDSRNLKNKFEIHTTSREQSNTFNLGFGIVEGTERIWHGSDTLVRDQDYRITYFSGEVELLSNRAQSYNYVEASYQQESLFLLDRRSLFGLNAFLELPNIGSNSYWSTTLMMMRMSSGSVTPRMGTEPFNRFAAGSSLNLEFDTPWMTSAVNTIPGIKSRADSRARFNMDIARSAVKSSVDRSRGAYVDNFSTSSRSFNLSTNHLNWYRSSPEYYSDESGYLLNPPAWHFYWYRPATGDNRTDRREIYPTDTIENQTEYASTLRLTAQPFPEDSSLRASLDESGETITPWAGIMRGFRGSLINREDDRYFEFHMEPQDAQGTLYIDMGEISQDLSLDGRMPNGTEDFELFSGTLTSDKDLGINSSHDSLETWYYPQWDGGQFFWEALNYTDERLGRWSDDPARDNFRLYDSDNRENRMFANGTAGNLVVNDTPDRENFNGDGRFLLGSQSQYFRYELSLEDIENNPFVEPIEDTESKQTGWYRVRLPVSVIGEPTDTVGEPTWDRITQVRLLWTDFAQSHDDTQWRTLEFEGIEFVGNQWTEYLDTAFVENPDDIEAGKVTASTLSSSKTEGYRENMPTEIVTVGGEEQTDYSLQIDFDDIPALNDPDSSDFFGVERSFPDRARLDFSPYKGMEFYLCEESEYTEQDLEIHPDNDVWFSFRFGNDDSSYYEFRTRELPRGGEWNWKKFSISLEAFTQMKLAWFNSYGPRSGGIDTSAAVDNGEIHIYSRTNNYPSLQGIQWISFGVVNKDGEEYAGRVKINSFKSTGVSNYRGTALSSSLRLDWADFMDNSLSLEYRDAGFRSMSDDINSDNNATMRSGMSGEIRLDRFFENRHGFHMPVGGNVNASMERPEIRASSDIELTQDGESDGFRDMYRDFASIVIGQDSADATGITPSEQYQNISRDYTFYTGYRKNQTSEGRMGRLFADRTEVSYDYSVSENTDRQGLIPENERGYFSHHAIGLYHAEISRRSGHGFELSYDATPAQSWRDAASINPFRSLGSEFLQKISLNALPNNLRLDLLNLDYSRTVNYSSLDEAQQSSYSWDPKRRLSMKHGFAVDYIPIAPLMELQYSLSMDRNFDRYLNSWQGDSFSEFIHEDVVFSLQPEWRTYGVLFSEVGRLQNAVMKLRPELGDWFDIDIDFGGNYSHSIDLGSDSMFLESRVKNDFTVATDLNLRRLFDDISDGIDTRTEDDEEQGGSFVHGISDFFDHINMSSVDFTYNAQMDLLNTVMTPEYFDSGLGGNSLDYFKYTLGVYGRSMKDIMTGSMNDAAVFGGVQNRNSWYDGYAENTRDTRRTNQSMETRTSFDFLPTLIDLRINSLSLKWNREYTVTPEPDRFDTTITWPDFTIGGQTSFLQGLEYVSDHFKTLTLSTAYNFKKILQKYSDFWDPARAGSRYYEDITVRYGLDPFVNIDGKMRNGLDVGYSFALTFDTTFSVYHELSEDPASSALLRETAFEGAEKIVNRGHDWTLTYRQRGEPGRTFEFFQDREVDVVGDVTYRGKVSLNRKEIIDYRVGADGRQSDNEEVFEERSFTFRPEVEYTFTDKVDLKCFYDMRRSINRNDRRQDSDLIAGEVTVRF
jgi:hypothetical protein